MHTRLLLSSLVVVLLVAACGGGGTGATNRPNATGAGATSKPAGQVDCDAIKTAAQQMIAVQLLAQFRTPENVASIKDKQIGNLDLDAFLAALAVLHALDGYATPLGDPKAAIDKYEATARAAKVLFETEPVTQAAIDAFNSEHVGTIGEFIGGQAAISGAIGEAGC
jgi:hypothetical protein